MWSSKVEQTAIQQHCVPTQGCITLRRRSRHGHFQARCNSCAELQQRVGTLRCNSWWSGSCVCRKSYVHWINLVGQGADAKVLRRCEIPQAPHQNSRMAVQLTRSTDVYLSKQGGAQQHNQRQCLQRGFAIEASAGQGAGIFQHGSIWKGCWRQAHAHHHVAGSLCHEEFNPPCDVGEGKLLDGH